MTIISRLFRHLKTQPTSYKLVVKSSYGNKERRRQVEQELGSYLESLENPPDLYIKYKLKNPIEINSQVKNLDCVTIKKRHGRGPVVRVQADGLPHMNRVSQINTGADLLKKALNMFYVAALEDN